MMGCPGLRLARRRPTARLSILVQDRLLAMANQPTVARSRAISSGGRRARVLCSHPWPRSRRAVALPTDGCAGTAKLREREAPAPRQSICRAQFRVRRKPSTPLTCARVSDVFGTKASVAPGFVYPSSRSCTPFRHHQTELLHAVLANPRTQGLLHRSATWPMFLSHSG